jgi:hypothetical protein
MKKLLAVLLAALMVFSVVACQKPAETKAPETEAPTEAPATVLEDKDSALWTAHGQYLLADGTANGWNGKSSDIYEAAALKAISLKDAKEIDEDLYKALKDKDVKYLYTIDLIFGTNDAGWSCKFLKDGVLYQANGSYAVKVAKCSVDIDGDTKVYIEDQWISHDHDANVESLTPATLFMPVWQEEADENGFSWADNPVVIGGAGLYTLVIAQYPATSAEGTPGYGMALIKKEDKEGIAYEEIVTFVPEEHTYGIVGTVNGWGETADIEMTEVEDLHWQGEVELEADAEIKVRADSAWDNSWGDGSENIKITEAGTYVVDITFDADGNGSVTWNKKDAE